MPQLVIVVVAVAILGAWLRWAITPVVGAYRLGRVIGRRSERRNPR
jgi:hypothetical protein